MIPHQTMTQNLQESVHREGTQTRVVGVGSEPEGNRRMATVGAEQVKSPDGLLSCLTNPHASEV